MDDQFYLNQQKLLNASKAYRNFWRFWGIYSVLAVFAAGFYLLIIGQWRQVILALAAFVLARLIISPLVYLAYRKPRPYQRLHFVPQRSVLFSEPTTKANSFPSDHAASFAAVAVVVYWFFPVLGLILLAMTLINGWARVVLGYHYVLHVLAGWLVGLASALAIILWLAPIIIR